MPRTLTLLILTAVLVPALCATTTAAQAVPQNGQQGVPQNAAAQAVADDEVARGKRLYEQGDVTGAIAVLRPATEHLKKDADAWYYLGLALNVTGKTKDARKAFEKAVKLRADWAFAHTGLAYTLLLLDKPRDAEREAERAVALDTNHAEAHYVLAAVNYRGEKFWKAAEETKAALRLKSDFPAAAILLGNILLNVYVGETARIAEQYPFPPDANEETRKPMIEKRNAALEPLKIRMRAAADQLETLARTQPGRPAATNSQEMADMLRVYGGGPRGQFASIFRQAEVTTKALITFKPEPGFTEKARQKNVTGVVRLRAVLSADGRVKYILVIKGLPYGLTEKTIAAASQIRFKPATIEGRPVSQFVVLEYNFNIY